jgi:2,4-dienoyl-CoA reductase-like NADH-dependent reductase (Old Yellow Enzyme family)
MPDVPRFPKLSRFKTVAAFRERLAALGLDLPVDDSILTAEAGSPLAEPLTVCGTRVGNRWCIHPMEGWDGTADGAPSEHTLRRWRRFGESGAKLIWGGEAVAVRHDGRANPNQLVAAERNRPGLAHLRQVLLDTHRDRFGTTDDLLLGLQLTHSGRFCRPNDKARLEPRIAYHHPILDRKFGLSADDDAAVWTDDQLGTLIDDYVRAARLAAEVGFTFVDIKACHGYLLHEFLSARTRGGRYGGRFENRTALLREIVTRVRDAVPSLHIGVRISAFDFIPFRDDEQTRQGHRKGVGVPEPLDGDEPYACGFGTDAADPQAFDLAEPIRLLEMLDRLGVKLINVSCGSPYYNPHIQRPAIFPPSDGYQPPEDPLIGVARQIEVTRRLKQACPGQVLVGTGYSYLQEYLPHVAQAVVRSGDADFVGLGRMVLAYPSLPADTLSTGTMQSKLLCRTFSDCTTAPRNGLISGCFPLDAYYKDMPEHGALKAIKHRTPTA